MTQSFVEYDGPYVFGESTTQKIISFRHQGNTWVAEESKSSQTIIVKAITDQNSQERIEFEVSLQNKNSIQESHFQMPSQILSISDIEGNFIALYSWLLANHVIDKATNWVFGNGHLVLVGDLMDRGDQVTQLLWLIYKLQYEADLQGGQVHCLIGNHDAMNLQMDLRYVHEKYISLAGFFSNSKERVGAYRTLWNPTNFLYKWMKNWPSIVKIGNFLFVHAGISEDLVKAQLSLDQVNALTRKHIEEDLYGSKEGDSAANLISGRMGPWWYRGMVEDYTHQYIKMKRSQIEKVKQFYQVDHVVVGHTVQDKICTSFEKSVIMIDVLHGWSISSGKTRGIRIEQDQVYVVNDLAESWPIPALDNK